MKLKEFLKQFDGLDPELPIYKIGYMVKDGKFMFYEDHPCDNKQIKSIILY